jgi:hypothetical protein
MSQKALDSVPPAPSPDGAKLHIEHQHQPSLDLGRVPARLLLADDPLLHQPLVDAADALASASILALPDPLGHTRPHYGYLVLHLLQLARLHHHDSLADTHHLDAFDAHLTRAFSALAKSIPPTPLPIDQTLWLQSCVRLYLKQLGERLDRRRQLLVLDALIASTGESGPLSPVNPDESPDTWTYRDLTALHALFNLGFWFDKPHWLDRARHAAIYHCENTQPDYFTNQPWALAAFLYFPQTRTLGEQQLHDCTLNAGGETGGLSTLTGMLLADAVAAMRVRR